jgi:replicative DNA helicase
LGAGDEVVDVSRSQRLPPHDITAEEAVLGAAMLSSDALATILERLAEDDFYRPAHRTVFAAVRDLRHRGTPVDAVTVAAELARAGALADVAERRSSTPSSRACRPPPMPPTTRPGSPSWPPCAG